MSEAMQDKCTQMKTQRSEMSVAGGRMHVSWTKRAYVRLEVTIKICTQIGKHNQGSDTNKILIDD